MSAFRHGIGMLVAATSVPVIPCNLQGTFDAMPPAAPNGLVPTKS